KDAVISVPQGGEDLGDILLLGWTWRAESEGLGLRLGFRQPESGELRTSERPIETGYGLAASNKFRGESPNRPSDPFGAIRGGERNDLGQWRSTEQSQGELGVWPAAVRRCGGHDDGGPCREQVHLRCGFIKN
ncbi:MAG: hypothetical protein DMF95_22720, partial [Acidobacteria bacterium]